MKTAVVTGAAQGIGFAIASRFRNEGMRVIVVDRQPVQDARFADLQIVQDLSEPGAVEKVFEQLDGDSEFAGSFEVLVNCAGIYPTTPATEISYHEWMSVLTLDLTVPFLMSQAAAKRWIDNKRSGSIVQISSTAAAVVRPGIAHYGAAKAGLSMLTRVLAVEWAEYGIRVNAVGPGLVVTETGHQMLQDPVQQTAHEEKLRRIPMSRTADADEIASVVQFLCSAGASYMTGQTIFADGGYTAGFPFRK